MSFNSSNSTFPIDNRKYGWCLIKLTLRGWNLLCAILHFLQFVAALAATLYFPKARDFRVPIQTSFAAWNDTDSNNRGPYTELKEIGLFPFAYVTLCVPLIAAIAHLFFYYTYYGSYKDNLANKKNPIRWIEYSCSSSLMFVLIAFLFGTYDIITLSAFFTLNVAIMYTGYIMEILNASTNNIVSNTNSTLWNPYFFGFFLSFIQWFLLCSSIIPNIPQMPGLVWGLVFSYAALYIGFPINMAWYFWKPEKIGPIKTMEAEFTRFEKCECHYMILSLVSKSLLLWLIFAGVMQPSNLK